MSVKSSAIVEQLGLNQSFGKRAQNGPKGSNLTSFSFCLKIALLSSSSLLYVVLLLFHFLGFECA